MNKLYLVIAINIFCFVGYSQNTYYVANNGNNANAGQVSNPWQTLSFGISQLTPGDTLLIRGGSYSEKLDIDVSGTTTAYITIKNYPNENVVLDAANSTNDNAIIWTDNAYLRIEGLHLTNNIQNNVTGITIQGAAHHIEFVNNKVSNIRFSSNINEAVTSSKNAVPIDVWADGALDSIHHILIKGNEVFDNQTGYSENIAAGGNFTDFVIEDNIVHDNTNIGIDVGGNYQISPTPAYDQGRNGVIRNNIVYNCNAPYGPAAGIYIDGGRDIIVENNICYNNGYGGEIGCEENGSTSNVTFRNNVFYNNAYAGMHIGGYDVNTTGVVLNSNIYNNTFYKNDTGNNYNGELILTKLSDCNIENNIFYISTQNVYMDVERTQTNLSLNYNLLFADGGSSVVEVGGNFNTQGIQNFYTASGYGASSYFGSPSFADALNQDFHLGVFSAAIDAGNPSYVSVNGEVDMDGASRVVNSIIDCGADEFSGVTAVNEFEFAQMLYPNPAKETITFKSDLKTMNYRIVLLSGQEVTRGVLESNTVNISEFSAGLYIIVLENSKERKVYRFVKG